MSEVIDRVGTAQPIVIDPVVKRMFTGEPPTSPPAKTGKKKTTFEQIQVGLVSDLHLDIGGMPHPDFWNYEGDVLLIAGDTAEFQSYKLIREFFVEACKKWRKIAIIAGNHEGYNSSFPECIELMKHSLEEFPQVSVLENESFVFEGVLFVGATLWTDMNRGDPRTLKVIKYGMNDFNIVRNSEKEMRVLEPRDVVEWHKKSKLYIDTSAHYMRELSVVVMTHHSPSTISTHPKYKDEFRMNGGYSSDLSDVILNNPNIKFWVHGHTHYRFKYNIGDCGIMCNPRGYPNEWAAHDRQYQPLMFQVDKG